MRLTLPLVAWVNPPHACVQPLVFTPDLRGACVPVPREVRTLSGNARIVSMAATPFFQALKVRWQSWGHVTEMHNSTRTRVLSLVSLQDVPEMRGGALQ